MNKFYIIASILILMFGYYYFFQQSNSDLVYYFSPNCPHCVKFMPVWDTINVNVNKKKINCDIQSCPGIQALPTIMINGNEFDGERTKENIEAFVQKNL